MNLNEYAGEYDTIQNQLSIENAENYLQERNEQEEKIEKYEALIDEIKAIVFDDDYYKNKTVDERLKDVKDTLKEV